MKRFMRCVIYATLVIFLVSMSLNYAEAIDVGFTSSSERILGIIDALRDVETNKDAWGLSMVDFEELRIGPAVNAYNHTESGFVCNNVMYPLMIGDELVLWAVPIGGQYQITNGLVSEVNECINKGDSFALVYDACNIYIYTGNQFCVLKETNIEIRDRTKSVIGRNTSADGVITTKLTESESLGYSNIARASSQTNVACNVSYVTQNPHNNLCWAATVACIVNYKSNTNLDAVTVAKRHFGNTNFDQGINPDALNLKLATYGFNYYIFTSYDTFEDEILTSLMADYPVGGSFDVINGGYHSTVIYGINVIAGRLQVMDPEFGMTTVVLQSDGKYRYVSNLHNTTLVLYGVTYDDGY